MRLPLSSLSLLLLAAACGDQGARDVGPVPGFAEGNNLLVVTLDTTRADRLGCYGFDAARTPVLDRLAARGVLAERALTVAPITLPAHASLFTGLYPIDHGVRDNGIFVLADESHTLAETLAARGYQTAAFVSSFILARATGIAQGFDHFDDRMTSSGGRSVHEVERGAADTVDAALAWLNEGHPEPWFLWLHFFDPHAPYEPPASFAKMAGSPYDREIAHVDQELGRFLERYGQGGRLERTLLVALSDHGEGLGEHREATHGLFVYDSTMQIPLILSHPALRPARIAGQIVLVDLMPTLLEALGVAAPVAMSGASFLGQLSEETPEVWHDAYLETQLPYYYRGIAPLEAVSTRRHKYIEAPRPELYDRLVDPLEVSDLARTQPAVETRLREQLLTFRAGRDPLESGPDRTLTEADLERLDALGYIQSAQAGAGLMDPKDYPAVMELRDLAIAAMDHGNYQQSAELLEQVLKTCPLDSQSRGNLGEALIHLGRRQEGIVQLEKCVAQRPHLLGAALNLARMYQEEGRSAEALATYDHVIERASSNVSAYLEATRICMENQDAARARAYLIAAQENAPLSARLKEEVRINLQRVDQFLAPQKR